MTTIQRSFGWKGRLGAVAATSTLGVVVSTGMTGSPASAYDNQQLSASRYGVGAVLTVDWINSNSFVLRNVSLTDTECDSQPVFFHVSIPGFQYPDHFNNGGCNSTTKWTALNGSSSGSIHSLWLTACRDTFIPECTDSVTSVNPYG